MKTQMYQGKTSIVLQKGEQMAFVTPVGGSVTPAYRLGGREIMPYFIAPWWRESFQEKYPPLFHVLRGNFFCFPMGGDTDGILGPPSGVHGHCAGAGWDLLNGTDSALTMLFNDPSGGQIKKSLRLDGTLIYENNRVSSFSGLWPVAYHPMLCLPDCPGAAKFSMLKPTAGFTTPEPCEKPADGGYTLLKPGREIVDMTAVETLYGDTEDLTRQPVRYGYEEIVQFLGDRTAPFAWSAVAFPEQGYLYFHLKDPNNLQSTLLWMSNGGRHYTPWNGRVHSVLGLEECTSFFHYGAKESGNDNLIRARGYDTAIGLSHDKTVDFPLIAGIAPIPESFGMVTAVEAIPDGVRFIGEGGAVDAVADLSWLKQGETYHDVSI